MLHLQNARGGLYGSSYGGKDGNFELRYRLQHLQCEARDQGHSLGFLGIRNVFVFSQVSGGKGETYAGDFTVPAALYVSH